MKILVVIPTYKPAYSYGGPTYSSAALCEAFSQHDHTVDVFTTNANGSENLNVNPGVPERVDNVSVTYFFRRKQDKRCFSFGLLKAFWRSVRNYDVIHVQSWWNLVAVPVVLICVIKGVVPVLSPRGSITNYTTNSRNSGMKVLFHHVLGRRLISKVVLHTTSLQEYDDVKGLVKPIETYIIPNMLYLPSQHTKNPKHQPLLSLLYFGRVERKKNIELLFEILLHQFDIPFELNIVGEGDDEYVNNLKKRTVGVEAIHWLGPIYDNSKFQRFADADILLLPSYNENFANVVLESLSQGTAVMISEHVGLKDYVLKNDFGWVLPNDAAVWKAKLLFLSSHREILYYIRNEAPGRIRKDFNHSNLLEQYMNMYSAVMDY